jgi:biopolymer transport protein ExbB
MWPLLVCSVVLGGVLIERLLVVVIGWKLFGATPRSLDWHRRILPFFGDIPPALGLLGTVVGVVRSFQLMNGHLDTEAVGTGLGIACMTTIFGLSIAIIASISGYLLNWITAGAMREGSSC